MLEGYTVPAGLSNLFLSGGSATAFIVVAGVVGLIMAAFQLHKLRQISCGVARRARFR